VEPFDTYIPLVGVITSLLLTSFGMGVVAGCVAYIQKENRNRCFWYGLLWTFILPTMSFINYINWDWGFDMVYLQVSALVYYLAFASVDTILDSNIS
jgi:hypothetical protein